MFFLFMQLLGLAVFLGFLVFVVRLAFADGDLVLLRKSLKKEYFRDRVVWVTGASSGIGEALVRSLSSLGAKVILSARSVEKLEAIQASLPHPELAKVLRLDVSETQNADNAVKSAVELFGAVDMLVNNAGISQRGLYYDFPLDVDRRVMEVDFFGQIALTKALLPYLVKQGGGHICNISSIAGKIGGPGRTIYSAAKFALIGFMDALRLELRGLDSNVAVTNVCPGPVITNVDVNSLRGSGVTHGREDAMIRGGMTTERCAELCLVAMSHRLSEAWVAKQPFLFFVYFAQYLPILFFKAALKAAPSQVKDVQRKVAEGEGKKDS